MATLIDRDELYKALASWDWQDLYLPVHFKELVDDLPVVRHSYEDGIRKGYEDAVLNYAKMALMQWIPVSERLPEKHGYYIVQTDGSRNHVIDIAEYGLFWHNMKQEMMWNKASKILAWMPLPKPYKTDKGSGIDED